MEINVNLQIKAPELANAIQSLATALAGNIELNLEGHCSRKNLETVNNPVATQPTNPNPAIHPAPAPVTPIPVAQPTPTPEPQTPVVAVPTAAPTYTMEQLAVAATQLVDAGRREELVQLLQQFGVQALTALPKEQYGAFATALRQMGAKV